MTCTVIPTESQFSLHFDSRAAVSGACTQDMFACPNKVATVFSERHYRTKKRIEGTGLKNTLNENVEVKQ